MFYDGLNKEIGPRENAEIMSKRWIFSWPMNLHVRGFLAGLYVLLIIFSSNSIEHSLGASRGRTGQWQGHGGNILACKWIKH